MSMVSSFQFAVLFTEEEAGSECMDERYYCDCMLEQRVSAQGCNREGDHLGSSLWVSIPRKEVCFAVFLSSQTPGH